MMLFLQQALSVLAAIFVLTLHANGETNDKLLSENEVLRRRISALETRFDVSSESVDIYAFWQDGHDGHDHFDNHGYATDHLENGHGHRHATIAGTPYIHLFKTEHAFLENKMQFDFAGTEGADDGLVDERELEFELFRALNSRWGVVLELPVIELDPAFGTGTSGIGDMEVGVQFIGFNGERAMLAFGLNVGIPIGDEDRDLGSGHTSLEPKTYVLYDLGGGTLFQGEFAIEIPLDVEEPENEFIYNMGLSHTLLQTGDWCFFRWLSPTIELNSITVLNGVEAGETVINVTPGVRWIVFDEDDQFGFAWSLPISGTRAYDTQFLLSYVWHF